MRVITFVSGNDIKYPGCTSKVLQDVADERCRQVEVEGFLPSQDDAYDEGILAGAAVCYLLHDLVRKVEPRSFQSTIIQTMGYLWPWCPSLSMGVYTKNWWKPKDRRRNLIRALALLIAEVERLDRHKDKETK